MIGFGSPRKSPLVRNISTIAVWACFTDFPASAEYCSRPEALVMPSGACVKIRPSRPMIGRVGKLSSRHHTTSVRSPNVQTMAMPVPLSICASSCASTGTATSNNGVRTMVPKNGLYRSSSGWATSATHAGMSSGRVVAITISPPDSCLKEMSWNAPGRSRSSNSAWATAVPKSTSHNVGASCA